MLRASCVAALLILCVGPALAWAQAAPAGSAALFELEQGGASLVWELAEEGQLQATATLQSPTLRVVRPAGEAGAPPSRRSRQREPGLAAKVERLTIHDGAVIYVQGSLSGRELLSLRELEATVENFATEREASGGSPARVSGRGRIGRAGRITFSLQALPWSEPLDVSGRAEISGLEIRELSGFVTQYAGQLPSVGTLSAVTEFSVEEGRITGTVEPTLGGVAADWLGSADSWLERRGLDLFGGEQKGDGKAPQQRVVVRLGGTLDDPRAGVAAALLGVLEQALVRSITAALPELAPGLKLPPGSRG